MRGKQKTRGVHTLKSTSHRMDLIRRDNVKRHAVNTARLKLREDTLRHQRVSTMQRELDNLHESSIRGSGLDTVRLNRMHTLKKLIQ